ncbi:MAG: indole-3-glycerol phosphate synthase TrpC [Planctomycetes bacterium]|nr:indole-3-glycerol phosphate synthase TrpC [Planctomycetota bacterium]
MSYSFLDEMMVAAQVRVQHAQERLSLAEVIKQAAASAPAHPLDLDDKRLSIIAEFKRATPSKGDIAGGRGVDEQLVAYTAGGASAVSVLTEPSRFHGAMQDLLNARFATPLPVMRKDFVVDPYQIFEARAFGADGVLLITAMLDDKRLTSLLETTHNLGMFALVETSGEVDIHRAIAAGAEIVGVNARNLTDLKVDMARHETLRRFIPERGVAIAESGINTAADVQRIAELGYDGALIGGALMQAADPRALLEEFVSAGRRTP